MLSLPFQYVQHLRTRVIATIDVHLQTLEYIEPPKLPTEKKQIVTRRIVQPRGFQLGMS